MVRQSVVAGLIVALGAGLCACGAGSGPGPASTEPVASTVPARGASTDEVESPAPPCTTQSYEPNAREWPISRAVVASVDAEDMNDDGYPDIVLAEGSDFRDKEGHLRVVWNPARPPGPSWVNARRDSWFRVRAADTNFDGIPDVVGTIYRPSANSSTADPRVSDLAFVYMSDNGTLPTEPSTVLEAPGNLIGSGISFVDVNGDNRLDVGLLVTDMATRKPHALHFYEAHEHGVSTEPVWTSETTMIFQSGARLADVDHDGALDLLVASQIPHYIHVFRGQIEGGRYRLSTTAEPWDYPDHQNVIATTLDVTTTPAGLRALVGFNDQLCPDHRNGENPACDGPLLMTDGSGGDQHAAPWRHMWGTARFLWYSESVTAIFGAHWLYTVNEYGAKERHPGPAVLYCGDPTNVFRETVPLTPGVTYFGIDSTIADFDRSATVNGRIRFTTTNEWTQGFGLPARAFAVVEVLVNGNPLPREGYAVTPEVTAISFAPPLRRGTRVDVVLRSSHLADIAIADVNPEGRDSIPIIFQAQSDSPNAREQ